MEHLAKLLLEFGRAPGSYPVRLRKPSELFDEFDTVAQWALNRIPDSLQHASGDLREAAILFIQRACFAPDSSHYQVLGLSPREYPAEELRSRYRIMIRLAHPDMGVKGLPPNAASLINQANEVLSNPSARARYDEQRADAEVPPMAGPYHSRRVRPASLALERSHGLVEKLLMLKASHPKAMRTGIVLTAVSVPVALVLVWAAQVSTDSRMLIVARSPSTMRPTAPPVSGGTGAVDASSQLRMSLLMQPGGARKVELPPATANMPSPDSAIAVASQLAGGTRSVRPSSFQSEALREPIPSQPTPSAAPAVPSVGWTTTSAPAPVAVSLTVPVPTTASAPLAVATAAPPREQVVAPAVATPPAPAVPPAPAQRGAPAGWTVDVEGARMYLAELVAKLDNVSEVKRVNNYLKNMKVKGSLLAPALKTMDERPDVLFRQTHWTDATTPGVLRVDATVLAQSRANSLTAVPIARYRVVAEFHGTEAGTVLAVLDMRESD